MDAFPNSYGENRGACETSTQRFGDLHESFFDVVERWPRRELTLGTVGDVVSEVANVEQHKLTQQAELEKKKKELAETERDRIKAERELAAESSRGARDDMQTPTIMLRSVLALSFLFALIIIPAQIQAVGGSCQLSGPDEIGEVEVAPVYQEQAPWCWVASARSVMDALQFRTFDPQCQLYNVAYRQYLTNEGVEDCCASGVANSTDACLQGGWPDYIFDKFLMAYQTTGTPLSWNSADATQSSVRKEICGRNTPFIYVVGFLGGGMHTAVVKGFVDRGNEKLLLVDDHLHGVRAVSYECKYKKDCAGGWNHIGNYYGISSTND